MITQGGNNKIKIGYFETLPTVQSTLAARRAVKIARDALEKQGFELVQIEFSLEEILDFRKIYT